MELISKKRLQIFGGSFNTGLTNDIAGYLDVKLGGVALKTFANGELFCRFDDSVRGSDAFIIQSHGFPVNEPIMQQLIMIDAAKRASAKRITAVCPFYGYARQDRKASGREPITAKLLANMLEAAGADRVISLDLHSGQIQGFFNIPFDHLTAMPVLMAYIRQSLPRNLVIVSPDAGRVKVTERFAQHLGADLAIVHKRRLKAKSNQVAALDVVGEVEGRPCLLIDDMIDTAGTICAAADQLKRHGAISVYAMATHAVLSGPASQRLDASAIEKVIVTDSLPPVAKASTKIEVLSVAPIIAQAIKAVFSDTSVSELFEGENQA